MIPEYVSTVNIIVSGIMGIIGSLITTPFTTWFAAIMRRREIILEYKLQETIKKQELLLAHKLEKERMLLQFKLQQSHLQQNTQ